VNLVGAIGAIREVGSCNVHFPEHSDGTPSFSLSANGLFNCWGCGKQGNFTQLLHDIAKFSWKKSAQIVGDLGLKDAWTKEIAQKKVYGQEPEKTINSAILGFFDVDWKEAYAVYQNNGGINSVKRPPWAIVFDKGFTPNTLEAFDAGYDSDDQRVTIPIWNSDKKLLGILGRACRSTEFKYVPYLNFKYTNHVYNLQATIEGEPVVLVEGAFDCWMLQQWKIPFTAIATMTSHMSERQALQILEKHANIYIFFDNDKGGWAGAAQAARLLTRSGGKVDIISSPKKNIKDLNRKEFLRAYRDRMQYPCVMGDGK
jgi:DNA primase